MIIRRLMGAIFDPAGPVSIAWIALGRVALAGLLFAKIDPSRRRGSLSPN